MRIKKFLSKFPFLKTEIATLTVVGVGPGDPSLLTISALKAIKKAKVIFFPISSDDKKSFSAEIVKNYIQSKEKIPIIFPMGRKEIDPNEIWSNAVEKIVKYIKKDKSVVLLCLGDTSLFASSSNILKIINNSYPEIVTKTIPGISSISAAAALSNFILATKGEALIIKECPSKKQELINFIRKVRGDRIVLVLMKVGKRWDWVKKVLKQEDIINKSVIALNLGMPDQIVQNVSKFESNEVPYFSLLLIRFKND